MRTTRRRVSTACLLGAALATASWAQALNIDFGEPADAPTPTYAAAGKPGVWNSILAEHGTTGAALNGMQIWPQDLFADGFESGDTDAWTAVVSD